MGEDMLRESSNAANSLTMALIGCLPDNVQQAIRSFSIKQGKQHITFSFPFMADMLKCFRSDVCPAGDATATDHMTPALFFDHTIDVIDGYHSYVTLMSERDRSSLCVVLFTLYQRDSSEGVIRHFQSLVKILLDHKTPITVWTMPTLIVDLSQPLLDEVVDICAQTIVDIQLENLLNTYHGKTKDELMTFVKEKMVMSHVRTYDDHFQCHLKEVTSRLRSVDPEQFLTIIDHLKSVNCTAVDFQKADLMMKSPSTDVLIRAFWKIWGQDQIACKVFPVALASYGVQNKAGGHYVHTVRKGGMTLDLGSSPASLSSMPVKEGLQSIIKCLKGQDTSKTDIPEKPDRLKGCSCHVCKTSKYDSKYRTTYIEHGPQSDVLQVQSAFYRPKPGLLAGYYGSRTPTPYSDALKAAAVTPGRPLSLATDPGSGPGDLVPVLPPPVAHTGQQSHRQHAQPYYLNMAHYKLAPLGGVRTWPMIYRPRILTHNTHFY